jgi:hypothetical protein
MTTLVGFPLFLIMLLGGCGASDDAVVAQAPATETQGGIVETELTVTVDQGDGKTDTWTLSCDAAGKTITGTHPDAAKACAALTAKGEQALPAVKPDMMCTQIYGGDQTATIKGTWNGKAVDASFNRKNGCEISRWNALEGLLPAAGGAGGLH